MTSLRTKDPADAIELPHSPAEKQGLQLRAASLGAGFLLHFTINSKLLCTCVIIFWDKPAIGYNAIRLSLRRSAQVCVIGSLKFGVLKPS